MSHSISSGALVVTSIAAPNAVLKTLSEGAKKHQTKFIVIGDTISPKDFVLDGCDFYSVEQQRALPFSYAKLCPERSYTRKNIGYLVAIAAGAKFIVETDDDNFPRDGFWEERSLEVQGDGVTRKGWLNAYHYFSDIMIYPRGFPLEEVRNPASTSAPRETLPEPRVCPIQQGLADENPDVDAIYRMLFPLPANFLVKEPLVLTEGTWCPFNSQNTTTFAEAFPLLYLPAFCSFRMTDIWRSFVAQRIAWACGWCISFHSSTVYQERNEHNLLRDFADEVSGYLNNSKIALTLDALQLEAGPRAIAANMRLCYEALIKIGVVDAKELPLLDAWLDDLKQLPAAQASQG